eukprot:jgi/Mesen1/60/ME1105415C05713
MEGGAVVDHRGALRGMLCRPLRQPAASAEIQLVVTESALVGVLRPFGVRTLPGDSQAPAETPGRAGRRRHGASELPEAHVMLLTRQRAAPGIGGSPAVQPRPQPQQQPQLRQWRQRVEDTEWEG